MQSTMPRKVKTKSPESQALRARREQLELSQEQLALVAGDLVSQSAVSDLETGRTTLEKLEARRVAALARALNWTLPELQEATGIDLAAPRLEPGDRVSHPTPGVFLTARRLASASAPTHANDSLEDVQIWVPNELMRRGTEPFVVDGASMSPSLENGEVALCDTRDTELRDGKVYVLTVKGDGECIKRARRVGDQWFLTSDNPKFQSFTRDSVSIIGRVYHVMPRGRAV
jgi:repressor LexA